MAKPDGTPAAAAAPPAAAAASTPPPPPPAATPPSPPRSQLSVTPPSPAPSPLPRAFTPASPSPPATPTTGRSDTRGRAASAASASTEPVVILSDGRLTGVRAGLLAQRDRQLGVEGERLSVMCIGETGVGKSTLLANLLGNASISAHLSAASAVASPKRGKVKGARLASPTAAGAAVASSAGSPSAPPRSPSPFSPTAASASSPPKTLAVTSTVVHILADGVPLAVTLIDSPGYGDVLNVEASFAVYTDYLDQRLRESLAEEESIARPADGSDLRVGGVDVILYFVAPHRLKGLDVELLSRLTHRAPVVPIISKADTLTASELAAFRESVATDLERAGINVFHSPLAVIAGPGGTRDRVYPWGTAHAENTSHSDLPALRRLLLVDGLKDLHVARRACYEAYRTRVLRQRRRGGVARHLATVVRRASLYTAVLLVVLPGMRQVLAEGVLGGAQELSRAVGELLDAAGAARRGRRGSRSEGGAASSAAAVAAAPRRGGGEVVVATDAGSAPAGPLRKLWALGALLAAPLVLLLRRPPSDV